MPSEFWTIARLEEFAAVLGSGRHKSVVSALAEYGEAYGRSPSNGSMRKRFTRYYGAAPSAMLGENRVPDPPDYPDFARDCPIPSPENDSAPTPSGPKPLETLAFLADAHLDPDIGLHPSWICAKNFITDKQPDVIVLGGDISSCNSIKHWDADKLLRREGRRYSLDVQQTADEISDIHRRCPSSRIVYILGNHEDWVRKHVEKNPELSGWMDWKSNVLQLEPYVEFVARKESWTYRGVTYLHGEHCNMYHSKSTLLKVGGHCMYGHVHKEQVHTLEQARNGVMVARSVGCLCDPSADYLAAQPGHTNGLGWVEYREDGFQATLISIVGGKLTFGGETWTA